MAWSEAARAAALEARRRKMKGRVSSVGSNAAQRTRVSAADRELLQLGTAGKKVPGVPRVTFGMKSKSGVQYYSATNKKGRLKTGLASLRLARTWANS